MNKINSITTNNGESPLPTNAEIARIHMDRAAWTFNKTDGIAPELKTQILNEIGLKDYAEAAGLQKITGNRREILPGGQVIEIVEEGGPQKQTYTNMKRASIPAGTSRREVVNGQILDFQGVY